MIHKKSALNRLELPRFRHNRKSRFVKYSPKKRIILFTALVVVLITPIIIKLSVGAYEDMTQTDWSGGVGTNPTNQYAEIDNLDASTAGELKLGATLNSANWCNVTDYCDNDMAYRQKITINNPAVDPITDAIVKIALDYNQHMQADFDDLRFVNSAGDTAFDYYITDKEDSNHANLLVKVPSLPAGESSFYVYFGQAGAASFSSVDDIAIFTDGFENGSIGEQWAGTTTLPSVYANDEANYEVGAGNQDNTTLSPNVGIVYPNITGLNYSLEFSLKAHENGIREQPCLDNDEKGNYSLQLFVGGSFQIEQHIGDACYDDQPFLSLRQMRIPHNSYNNWYDDYTHEIESIAGNKESAIRFKDNMFHDFRIEATSAGKLSLYSKEDTASNYNHLTGKYFLGDRMIQDAGFVTGMNFLSYANNVSTTISLKDYYVFSWHSTSSLVSITESISGASGNLQSAIIDMGNGAYYGNVSIASSGDGLAKVHVISDSSANMSTSPDWLSCKLISSGDSIYDSNCVDPGERYIQYRIYLSSDSNPSNFKVDSVNFEYDNDIVAPSENASNIVAKASTTGPIINVYSNSFTPYYSWNEAEDADSDIAGYCLYFGTDSDPDLQSSAGLLSNFESPENTNGKCKYAISDNSIDISTILDPYNSRMAEYVKASFDSLKFFVRAYDSALNLYQANEGSSLASYSYTLDLDGPEGIIIASNSTIPTNIYEQEVSWIAGADALGLGFNDEGSGFAGLKYCISNMFTDSEPGASCFSGDPGYWYGDGLIPYGEPGWASDVIKYDVGHLTTRADHPTYINSPFQNFGIYLIMVAAVDNVGNLAVSNTMSIQRYSRFPSGIPQDLKVSPASNIINRFSFSWKAPAPEDNPYYDYDTGGTSANITPLFEGLQSDMSYCWSINEPMNEACDCESCHLTDKGSAITGEDGTITLPTDAYAKIQGVNTFYATTINPAGNISKNIFNITDKFGNFGDEIVGSNVASINFTVDTLSPGVPTNFFATDISIRDEDPTKSSLQLALTWKKPTNGDNFVDKYIISRSTDGVTYDDDFGTTSKTNLSFIDSGLEELTYYYKVRACDDADSCSNDSEVVSETPVGYYTSPPALSNVSVPLVSNIGNRKATISWTTDRESDSKIQFGESSGVYFPEEIGNSLRETNHVVNLTNLQPGTTYYYIAKWTDAKTCKGNCAGQSDEQTFTTLPAPVITEVAISDISIANGTVNFTTENSSKVNLYYGKTSAFGGAKTINTSSELSNYSISLSDLDDGTKYYIKINGFDIDGNEYNGNVYSFTTLARPRISNLRFQPVAGAVSNTTEVTWTTNVAATSELTYGIVGKEQTEVIDSKLVTDHKVTISNLEDDKNYILVARSRDALGNLATSDSQAFKTALDTRPPKISNVTVETSIKGSGSEARGQIIISWTTDEPATSQVAYNQGVKGNYSNKTAEDSRLSTEHLVIVSDLSTSSIYQVQAISKDKASNSTQSINQSAIIGRGTEDVFTIIFNSLRNIFGVKS